MTGTVSNEIFRILSIQAIKLRLNFTFLPNNHFFIQHTLLTIHILSLNIFNQEKFLTSPTATDRRRVRIEKEGFELLRFIKEGSLV